MESRLEPPNPIPPKEDSNVKPNSIEQKSNLSLEGAKKDKVIEAPDTNIEKGKLEENENNNKDVKPEVTHSPDNKENDSVMKNKNDEIKKQDLMETIKRHEKEQREIIQEQKEILKEMKKTQKELEEENLLKKVADNALNEIDNKKIAVENIQKLAKLAIESLGGKLDIVTEKSEQLLKNEIISIENDEKKVNKNEDNNKSKVSKELHIQKKDEPDSYKMGKNLEELKINKETEEKNVLKSVLIAKPPIPIALSMVKEKLDVVQSNNQLEKKEINNVKPISVDENTIQNSYTNDKRNIVETYVPNNNQLNILQKQNEIQSIIKDEKPKSINLNTSERNYMGGKRDILEIHDKNSAIENGKNDRRKRETDRNCEKDQSFKDRDVSIDKIDLKLSITLTEPENKIRKQSSIDTVNLSPQSDLIKQTIATD